MRILTVVTSLARGGIERVAVNHSLGYQQAHQDVAVLALQESGVRSNDLLRACIPVFVGGETQAEQQHAIEQAIRWKPDVVHIHRAGTSDAVTGNALRALRKNINPFIIEKNAFARIDYSSDRHLIDIHFVLSKWCLWKWQRWSQGLHPKPIAVVIPNIVSSDKFFREPPSRILDFKSKLGIPTEDFVFGRIGQPITAKWSAVAISAFAEISRQYGRVHLLLAEPSSQIKHLIEQLPEEIRSHITILPFIYEDEQLRLCYSAMDAFLHSAAIGESFGSVLVEAMMCGIPVITLSTPAKDNSQIEVVGHMKGGLVASNKDGFVKNMVRLLEDRDFYNMLATNSRDWCVSRFDTSIVIPKILQIIEVGTRCNSRTEMLQKFEQHPGFITRVDHSEIESLLRNTTGKPSSTSKFLMELVHVPWLYRLWRNMQRLRAL